MMNLRLGYKIFFILTLILLLSLNLYSLPTEITNVNSQYRSVSISASARLNQIISVATLGLAIGLILSGIAYILGKGLANDKLISWSKNEIYETIYSSIIFATIFLLVYISNILIFPASPQGYLVDDALSRIDALLFGNDLPTNQGNYDVGAGLTTQFYMAYGFNIFLNTLGHITDNIINLGSNVLSGTGSQMVGSDFNGGSSVKVKLLEGVSYASKPLGELGGSVILGIIILLIQKAILIFILGVSPIILGVGFFFRSLPVFRRLGSTLIAMFIVLEFVYPATIVLFYSDMFMVPILKDAGKEVADEKWMAALPEATSPLFNFISDGIYLYNPDKKYYFVGSTFLPNSTYHIYEVDSNGNNIQDICKGIVNESGIINCEISSYLSNLPKCLLTEKNGDKYVKFVNSQESLDNIRKCTRFLMVEIDADYGSGFTSEKYSGKFYVTALTPLIVSNCDAESTLDSNVCFDNYRRFRTLALEFVKSVRTSYYLDSEVEENVRAYGNLDNYAKVSSKDLAGFTYTLGRIGTSWGLKRMGKSVAKKLASQAGKAVAKSAVKEGAKKSALLLAGGASTVITGGLALVPLKSFLISTIFNLITCDPYTSKIARAQVDSRLYEAPKVVKTPLGKVAQVDDDLSTGVSSFLNELWGDVSKAYSESDYTTCDMVYALTPDAGLKVVNAYSIPIIFMKLVGVITSMLMSIIISVSLYRSIAEVIGGDPSLLGLGRLIR